MAQILPETEPRSVASLNKRLCGWEASASDETARLKLATFAVPMNRARCGKTERKHIGPSTDHFPADVEEGARGGPNLGRKGTLCK
jgi:hypothetical protein